MLALTLKHPWIWAVREMGKRVENRTWRPAPGQLRPGDWFALHGGAFPAGAKASEWRDDLHWIKQHFPAAGAWLREHDDRATIVEGVGVLCRFGGCVTASERRWFSGPFGWLLENVIALPDPVPCKGARGLWELPPDVEAEVSRQRRHAVTLRGRPCRKRS